MNIIIDDAAGFRCEGKSMGIGSDCVSVYAEFSVARAYTASHSPMRHFCERCLPGALRILLAP